MPTNPPSPNATAARDRDGTRLFLRTHELAARWNIRPQTIRVWRLRGTGPRYVRLTPTLVAYPLAEVLRFESERTFDSTSAESVARAQRPGGAP